MSRIYMIRHGQASFGKQNYDELSEKGRQQCRILAEFLIRAGLSFDAVYAGDMVRQQHTAGEIISAYRAHSLRLPEMIVMPGFNEYSARDILLAHIRAAAHEDEDLAADLRQLYEDKRAFRRVFEKIMARWVSGVNQPPGVIRWQDFREQVHSTLQSVMQENGRGKNILVSTSGGPISAAVQMALSLSDQNTLRTAWHLANTSVTTFVYDGQRMELKAYNNISHLELLNDPEWITYR